MRITKYDTFFFGLTCGFIIIDFFNKEFIGAAIKGFIMGLYLALFCFPWGDANCTEGEEVKEC